MKIINKQDFFFNLNFYKSEILNGKIFIYPTDTIYGLGCILSNQNSIQKIFLMKKRDKNKPLSIIIPNKNWIYRNCNFFEIHKKYIAKLPGKYTLILNLNKEYLKKHPNSLNSIGVRIPDNWFSKIITELNIEFITTSVNLSNEPNLTNISDLNIDNFKYVDYFIDEGVLNNESSSIIDLRGIKEKYIRN